MKILSAFVLLAGLLLPYSARADQVDDLINEFFETDNLITRIIRDFPEEREGAVARLRTAFETGSEEVARQAGYSLGVDLGAKYTKHYIARASNEAVLGFLNMQLVATHELSTTDPSTCFTWAFGVPGGSAPAFSADTSKLMSDIQLSITKATDQTPQFLDGQEFEAMSQRVGAIMASHFNADHLFFDGLTNPASVQDEESQRKACLTYYGFIAGVSLLPRDDAASYFRTMMTSE